MKKFLPILILIVISHVEVVGQSVNLDYFNNTLSRWGVEFGEHYIDQLNIDDRIETILPSVYFGEEKSRVEEKIDLLFNAGVIIENAQGEHCFKIKARGNSHLYKIGYRWKQNCLKTINFTVYKAEGSYFDYLNEINKSHGIPVAERHVFHPTDGYSHSALWLSDGIMIILGLDTSAMGMLILSFTNLNMNFTDWEP